MKQPPHLDSSGNAYMVDVTEKKPTVRAATAVASVVCSKEILEALRNGTVPKGDVFVHGCEVSLDLLEDRLRIEATVRTADRTGVEMEALTAVNVAALNVIDMVKGVDRSAYISNCAIIKKSGGRSGDWSRPEPQ